jgi:ribonuclease BN (tRNA processing enzyme)
VASCTTFPKKVYKDIKAMRPGESFEMPSGETIRAEEVLLPARAGRKVIILGDTCDASSMVPFAQGADLVVHEVECVLYGMCRLCCL